MDEAKKEQVEYIEEEVKFDPEEIFEEALKHIDEMKIARRSAKIEVVSFSWSDLVDERTERIPPEAQPRGSIPDLVGKWTTRVNRIRNDG